MKINVQYNMVISQENLDEIKKELCAESNDEVIGFLKALVKSQSSAVCKIESIRMSIIPEAPNDGVPSTNLS